MPESKYDSLQSCPALSLQIVVKVGKLCDDGWSIPLNVIFVHSSCQRFYQEHGCSFMTFKNLQFMQGRTIIIFHQRRLQWFLGVFYQRSAASHMFNIFLNQCSSFSARTQCALYSSRCMLQLPSLFLIDNIKKNKTKTC